MVALAPEHPDEQPRRFGTTLRGLAQLPRRTAVSARWLDGASEAELVERASRRLGETLRDKYRLDRVLGVGAMAAVYAATHRNGKEVALKLLHPELAHHPDLRSRFLREGYVANQVKHSGAVAVLDDEVTESGDAFLVMELLSGVTVEELWEARGHRLHPAWVTAITLQVLRVVASAHAHGIIHRDLKPANLFVTDDGDVKVLDFGIARMRTADAIMTNLHAVLGTPAFMAPEQAMGRTEEIDETTDLWAVAAVAFALLVGDVVHPAESTQATLVYAATREARALGPLAPDAPPSIVAVVDRALSFDRAARWPSARAMRAALVTAAIEAYQEVPGATALREARGFAPGEGPSNADEELVRGEPLRLSRVASPTATVAGVARDTSGRLRGRARSLRPRLAGRVPRVAALAVVAVGVLTLARLRAAGGSAVDEPTSTAEPGPVCSSSRPLVAAALPHEEESRGAARTAAPVGDGAPSARPVSSATRPRVVEAAPVRTAIVPKVVVPASPACVASRTTSAPPLVADPTTKRKRWKVPCL